MQSTKHSTGLVSRLLVFTVLISAANSAWAAERVPCATSRKVVAACYMVHGRLSLGNGNPAMRMWKIGTTRMLGIYDGNFKEQEGGPLFELLPAKAAQLLDSRNMRGEFVHGRIFMTGDFAVCPLTSERAGWMQMACIKSAGNLIVHRRN